MFNVSMIMENGRCIVWHGDADNPAHAVEMAIAYAVHQTGTEAVDITWREDADLATKT